MAPDNPFPLKITKTLGEYMRKLFCLLLVLSIIGTTTVYASGNSNNSDSDGDFTYFVAGLDDAGNNTDVMILVRYFAKNNSVMLIQIPRDTYFSGYATE